MHVLDWSISSQCVLPHFDISFVVPEFEDVLVSLRVGYLTPTESL